MNKQLRVSVVLVALFSLLSGCEVEKQNFEKGGGGGGGNANPKPTEAARIETTRQNLLQLEQAKTSIESLATGPKEFASCSEATPRPGTNPFMVVDYTDCPVKFSVTGGKAVRGTFSGSEEYSVGADGKTIEILAVDLDLTVKRGAKTEEYTWSRKLVLGATLDGIDDLIGKGVLFSLDQEIKSTKEGGSSWRTSTVGEALLGIEKGEIRVTGYSPNLRVDNRYVRSQYSSATKKWVQIKGRLLMKADSKVTFLKNCNQLSGLFKWEFSEGSKLAGVLKAGENGLSDPTGKDPIFKKPNPWEGCSILND